MSNLEVYGYIYMIEHVSKKKRYIGQTNNVKNRMCRHKSDAKSGMSGALYDAIRLHGVDSFTVSVIDYAFTKEELNEAERYYIELYDTFHGEGYNCTEGGEGVGTGENNHFYGRKHSEESREKMSRNRKNKLCNGEHPMATSIIQLTLKGEFVAEYSTINECAEAVGVSRHAISNCCRGKSKSSGGYKWVYKDEKS